MKNPNCANLLPVTCRALGRAPAHCILLTFLLATCVAAQEAKKDESAPPKRPARKAPLVSPELRPDGSVTFRLQAPKASQVSVQGQFGPEAAMAKDQEGVWSATVPAVPAGIFEYHFNVDGLNVIDPQNAMIKPQRWPGSSILHVPANPPALWDLQDIPHGVLHEHTYRSKALDRWRQLVVYTPPEAKDPVPVLYLSHGYSDNERSWSVHGKAHWIMDALIAQKKAVPMVVVMMDGHALVPGGKDFNDYGVENSAALCRELVEDIIPLVERTYNVRTEPKDRAFVGLSMGGHHACTVALRHHDRFHWIGAFSAAPPAPERLAAEPVTAADLNRDLRLFWIACGKDDFLFKRNQDFDAWLTKQDIRHQFHVTDGSHAWPVWRRYLADIVPLLFR